jgi:hypothetical protein
MDIKGQEELYKILSDKKLYTKSFDEFKSQFSVPEGQAKLYQGMVDKGLYKKSQKDFTNQFFGAEKKNPIQPGNIEKATDLPQVLEKPKSSSGGGMVAMAPTSESELPQPKPGQSQGALLIPPKEVQLPITGTIKGVQPFGNYDVTKKGWFNPNADIKIDIPVVRKKTLQASKDLAQQAKSLDQESILLDNEIVASREYAKKNSNDPLLQQKSRDLDDKIDLYNKKLRQFKVDRFNVNQDRAELKKASVQNFINKKDEGNFLGATWNSIVEGYTKIGQAQARIAIDLGIELLDKIGKPWAPANTKLTKDEAKKEVINQMMPTIAKGYEQVKDKGTSKEYIEAQKASGTLPKAWFGAMESIPVMASGPGLGGTIPRFVTGASLAYQYANEDLDNNPATESMDENERKKITVPIAVIGGILEELGFRTLIGKNKPALISLVNLIIKELPIDAGIETIKQVSKQVLKTPAAQAIASGSGKLAVAYLGEAETGGAQKISDFAIKEIYDKANKLNLFKNPKFFSNEFLSKIAEDANVEGVGGVMMRAIGIGASSAMSVKGVEGMSDKEYKAWTDLASDADQVKLYLTKIATDVSSGRITQEEGEKRIDIIQKATEIVNQIPNDLSIPDQKKAFAIIADNLKIETRIKELNDYMAGKNTNLVGNINAEIVKLQKQIEKNNQELSKLPQNAVQEQTTSEIPIQPEAGIGEQMAEGEPQAEPQGTTKEVKTEEVTPSGAGGKIQMAETEQPTTEQPVDKQKVEQTNAVQKGIDAVNKGLKRGRPKREAIQGGISFMQQTIAYEEADDITREQMVRDINKEFGVKEKRAPSVEKLGLKEKAKKVLIDSKKLLDERLVEIDQSIKEGQRNFKTAVKDLATDIKAMLPKGVFSTSQVKVITNAMASNLLNPKLRQDAVNRVIRVVNNVAEATKLKEVYNLRSKIKSAKKDELAPELVNIANNFVEIDPRYIDNIDKHLEKAKEIFDAVKAVKVVKNKETGEKELNPREIIDYQSAQDYVEKQLKKQEEIIKDALLQQYSDLVDQGKISDAMSIQQIKAYIKELEEGKPKDDEKDKLIMDYAQASFDESKEELEEQIEDGDIDPEDLPLIEGFTKMDLSSMSPMQAYQVAEALMNYRMNGSTSNMGKLLDNYIGAFGSKVITDQISREGVVNVGGTRFKRYQVIGKAIDKIVQLLSGGRLNPETEKISKAYSDLWLELNSTVDNLGVTYFGPTNWKAIKEAAGLDRIIQGVVERKIIVDQFEKEIYDKYKNKKIAGNAFFTAKSSNMLGIIANLYRETSDPDKQETYFTDRKTILKETIDHLVNSKNKSDQAQGKLLQEIYDELGIEDATSGQEVFDNSDPVAQEAITDFINKFKQYYPQFSKIAQEQFNVLLGQDNNYTGDSWNRVDKAAQTSEDKLFKKGNFRMNTDIVDTETIGRFTKPKYPSKLPKKDGRATRIANYDFIKNNVNAFAEMVNTVKTIGGVNQYTGFMDSPNFQKLITDEDSRNLFKDRIDYNVGLYQMNENLGMQNKNIKKFVNSAMIRLGSRIGTRVGLSSMESVFTQSLPILTNTGLNLKNPGYLLTALQYLENADMKDFLNNINYGIRERGNSAQTNIDYADNMLEKGDYSTPDKTIETLNKVSKFWVNDVLVGTDVLTAKVTWMAYYMDELAKKEGVNPVEINWKNHKVNDEAAKYAEYMVQREQNINLPESGGKLWSSKDSGLKLIRMMMPFASFTTSQKDKIKTNMSVLFADKNIATKEDKIAAARSVVASVGEQWVFNGLKALIAEQLTAGAYRIVGKKETDEEKKLREQKAKYKTYADLYESLNGTIPLIENEVASITNNLLLEKLEDLYSGKTKDKKPIKYPFGEEPVPKTQRQLKAERLKKEIKKPFKFYESKEAPIPETAARLVGGVTMVAYDAWSKIVQEVPNIVAGGMENESGDKIKFTQEEINKLKVANAFKIGAALGLGVSREFKTIANNATKIIKENATMRYKRRKAEQKRMNAEMNN